MAMLEGLKHALKSLIARVALQIYIFLDNLEVVSNAGKIFRNFSEKAFRQFRNLAKD